ncbi:MAG: hypothetical protein EBQ65_03500 [Chitinophagaceae bacterium]|nr:hypothetical protein [Chitinophagaceae bacterium]
MSGMRLWQTSSLSLTILFSLQVAGQDLSGIWKGYFVTKDYSQYKVEFQLKQTGSQAMGVSYSYLTTVYYGKATMTGRWDDNAQQLLIQENKTVEIKASDGSVNCLMNYKLGYSKSGREEYLEGTFTSKYEENSDGIKKGDDCGGGRVYLRRVTTSDFYPEPFLQKSAAKKVIINEAPPIKKANPEIAAKNNEPQKIAEPRTEGPQSMANSQANTPMQKQLVIPSVNNNRFNDLTQVITVKTPQVQIYLYDNGEIDGDTITVYLNNKMVLSNKRLSTAPISLNLLLDEENSTQEVTIVAENLGRIPPNSALMIVEAGIQRFRVQLTSTEQKNAVVRIRYEK